MNLAELKVKYDRIAKQIDLTERVKALEDSVLVNVHVFGKGGGPPTVFKFQNQNDVGRLLKMVHQFVTTELQLLEGDENEDMAR